MKYFLSLIFVCLTLSSFSQNQKEERKIIEETAKRFIESVNNEKFDEVKTMCTNESKHMLEEMKTILSMSNDPSNPERKEAKKNVKIKFNHFQFDKAKHVCAAYYTSSSEPTKQEVIYLVKNANTWLIDLEGSLPIESDKPEEVQDEIPAQTFD